MTGATPARSLGDNIGSADWLEAKKKQDEAKKYSQQLNKFNKMKQQRKETRQNRELADTVSAELPSSKLNADFESDFGRNSGMSFASAAFTSNSKGKTKSIKEKQLEYAQVNVPKPRQRKQWKQDISHL